jgi:small subunit ribosomal protein S20
MPITKSAKKRLRQDLKRRKRNLAYKLQIKKTIKEFKEKLKEDEKIATSLLSKAYKIIDKAAKEKVIKKQKASRLKKRLVQKLNQIKASPKKDKEPAPG